MQLLKFERRDNLNVVMTPGDLLTRELHPRDAIDYPRGTLLELGLFLTDEDLNGRENPTTQRAIEYGEPISHRLHRALRRLAELRRQRGNYIQGIAALDQLMITLALIRMNLTGNPTSPAFDELLPSPAPPLPKPRPEPQKAVANDGSRRPLDFGEE